MLQWKEDKAAPHDKITGRRDGRKANGKTAVSTESRGTFQGHSIMGITHTETTFSWVFIGFIVICE